MSTITTTKTSVPETLDVRALSRILEEGYGPGAWHGADMKAALADVSNDLAFWRPSPQRHNIAEIALHHAYYVRQVRGRLTGREPGPFVLEGEDWFPLADGRPLSWAAIVETVDREQQGLADAVRALDGSASAMPGNERIELVLGITCHAVYHAGQVQLLKKLAEERPTETS
jgi:DinB superfamily